MFAAEAPNFLPIWSCSVWGLPCPRHYCSGGALLPHLFTLTSLPRRYVFCGTFRRAIPALKARGPSRTLSGTLLCGVRTFLSPRPKAREAAVRSGCLPTHYMGCILKTDGIVDSFRVCRLLLAFEFLHGLGDVVEFFAIRFQLGKIYIGVVVFQLCHQIGAPIGLVIVTAPKGIDWPVTFLD